MIFSGIITALVTPFLKGRLDKGSFLRLLRRQARDGIRQFVLAGTTGESPVLELEELKQLCGWFKEFEREEGLDLKLILATGSFSTKATVEKSKKALDLGAQGLLVVTPYYNRPSQKGLLLHFEKVAGETSLPVLLYNVPSRTACSFTAGTIKTLSQMENITGIKEASGDMDFFKEIQQQGLKKDFCLLSGDDLTCMEFFLLGGHGSISAAANVLARELLDCFKDPKGKLKEFEKYKPFLRELFKETNPVGAKQILAEQAIIDSSELRLPLVALKNSGLSEAFQNLHKN